MTFDGPATILARGFGYQDRPDSPVANVYSAWPNGTVVRGDLNGQPVVENEKHPDPNAVACMEKREIQEFIRTAQSRLMYLISDPYRSPEEDDYRLILTAMLKSIGMEIDIPVAEMQ